MANMIRGGFITTRLLRPSHFISPGLVGLSKLLALVSNMNKVLKGKTERQVGGLLVCHFLPT
jgi:hypothetical protein